MLCMYIPGHVYLFVCMDVYFVYARAYVFVCVYVRMCCVCTRVYLFLCTYVYVVCARVLCICLCVRSYMLFVCPRMYLFRCTYVCICCVCASQVYGIKFDSSGQSQSGGGWISTIGQDSIGGRWIVSTVVSWIQDIVLNRPFTVLLYALCGYRIFARPDHEAQRAKSTRVQQPKGKKAVIDMGRSLPAASSSSSSSSVEPMMMRLQEQHYRSISSSQSRDVELAAITSHSASDSRVM